MATILNRKDERTKKLKDSIEAFLIMAEEIEALPVGAVEIRPGGAEEK